MTDGVSLRVVDAVSPNLAPAFAAFEADLLTVAQALGAEMVDRARDKASGDLLQVRSGRYLASLDASVTASGNRIAARVSSDLAEAGILEFGGTTAAHDILPGVAKALRFDGGVGAVYAAVVHDPGATIGPHPVLRSTLEDMAAAAIARFEAAAIAFAEAL